MASSTCLNFIQKTAKTAALQVQLRVWKIKTNCEIIQVRILFFSTSKCHLMLLVYQVTWIPLPHLSYDITYHRIFLILNFLKPFCVISFSLWVSNQDLSLSFCFFTELFELLQYLKNEEVSECLSLFSISLPFVLLSKFFTANSCLYPPDAVVVLDTPLVLFSGFSSYLSWDRQGYSKSPGRSMLQALSFLTFYDRWCSFSSWDCSSSHSSSYLLFSPCYGEIQTYL